MPSKSPDIDAAHPQQRQQSPLRILAVSNLWHGANDYAFVRAFRRMGHSVRTVTEREFLPPWKDKWLRIARRLLLPRMVADYNRALLAEARILKPDLFFVFKGAYVTAETLRQLKSKGIVTIQFYPDVSFRTHGSYLPKALPEYDWIFNTKSFGLKDLADQMGVAHCSFLPHAFDPETHVRVACSEVDIARYACELSFIGNHSEKKQDILTTLRSKMPDLNVKIWGPDNWSCMPEAFQKSPVWGHEYAKAIQLSKINLALLREQMTGASSGDLITARTFEIPGAGGFMLHERTEEAQAHFREDVECAMFDGVDEMVAKIRHYLSHDAERRRIAAAGRQRCLSSGYSTEDRARTVIEKYHALKAIRPQERTKHA